MKIELSDRVKGIASTIENYNSALEEAGAVAAGSLYASKHVDEFITSETNDRLNKLLPQGYFAVTEVASGIYGPLSIRKALSPSVPFGPKYALTHIVYYDLVHPSRIEKFVKDARFHLNKLLSEEVAVISINRYSLQVLLKDRTLQPHFERFLRGFEQEKTKIGEQAEAKLILDYISL